ncbi:unnamed protein product [Adineta steineri]|uniref:Uncharacterized protein n=1 Tax=Adineta steineri TaxID=433720 RepID=A0A813YQI5_9BILA|nr:unnamed protein product [Adineta steineri]CAF3480367.1 unnamed protein product [Adineta steineri]
MATKKMKCSEERNHALWTLGSTNNGAHKGLLVCKNESATEYEDMKKHLQSTPGQGIPGILTQMRLDTRVWEYKLPHGKRVLYIVDVDNRKVLIGYAGQHLNKRCTDEKICQLGKKY